MEGNKQKVCFPCDLKEEGMRGQQKALEIGKKESSPQRVLRVF